MSGHWSHLLAPPLASPPPAAVLVGQAAAWVVLALRVATRRASRVVRRVGGRVGGRIAHRPGVEASHE